MEDTKSKVCPKSPKDEETGAKSKKTPNDQGQEKRSDTWLCAVDGTTKAEEICPDSLDQDRD